MEKFMPSEQEVLRCGEYLVDEQYIASKTWQGLRSYIRIRIIKYTNGLYYHKMKDGAVIEFKRLI